MLATTDMLPAVAQGAIGIACRADDEAMLARLAGLDHGPTHSAVLAERAMLARLEGSCRTPIAALAEIQGETLALRGLVATPDGTMLYETADSAAVADAVALGTRVAETLLDLAGPDFVIGAG